VRLGAVFPQAEFARVDPTRSSGSSRASRTRGTTTSWCSTTCWGRLPLAPGRLRPGVGIGWNDVEYEALGQPFGTRAARS